MVFPKRVEQHIIQSDSFKIFNYFAPSSWILREITERDYGIDCYIEITNPQNELIGDLVSIQLKGKSKIDWRNDLFSLYGIKISTSNYWYNFGIPVFIIVVDTSEEKIYFNSVKKYIRQKYFTYIKQSTFNYEIDKSLILKKDDFSLLLKEYDQEKNRVLLETYVVNYFAHSEQYEEYIDQNIGADFFLGVEWEKELYIQHIYNLFKFLCNYFNIAWDLKPFCEYLLMSKKDFGDNYNLYERYASEILEKIQPKIQTLSGSIMKFISKDEEEYWYNANNTLYDIAFNKYFHNL